MYRFYCEQIDTPEIVLSKDESRHISSVLRLNPAEEVELFDGKGKLAEAIIKSIGKKNVEMKVTKLQHFPPIQNKRIIIAASISKGDRFEWMIEKCTELGVDRIIPVLFKHTVKMPKNPRIKERWKKKAISACKQSKRIFLPEISEPLDLPHAVQAVVSDYKEVKLAHGEVSPQQQAIENIFTGDIAVFIGPEGGISPNEADFLKEKRSCPIKIGNNILRIETAAVAFTSILSYLRER